MSRNVRPGIKKLSSAVALVSAELILVFGIFFISLSLLVIVIRQIFYHKQDSIDQKVFDYLSHYTTDAVTVFMQFFTFLGSHFFLIPAWLIVFAYYFFVRKQKWHAVKLITIGASNLLLMFGLKLLFNRPRPLFPLLKEVPGLSFPSGHAFMSLTFFGLLIYLAYRNVSNKWIKWIVIAMLLMIIFVVGLSRVYLRLHYASDVIAGFCFGILALIILLWMLRQVEKYNAKKLPHHLNVTNTEEVSSLP